MNYSEHSHRLTSVLLQSNPLTGLDLISSGGLPTEPFIPSQSLTEEISPNGT